MPEVGPSQYGVVSLFLQQMSRRGEGDRPYGRAGEATFFSRITMGRCCVPNCKGNYDNGPKMRLFSFPSDPVRKAKWQRAVWRDDIDVCQLKNPQVCELHFKAEHFRTTSKYTDGDGRTIEVPMKLTWPMPDVVSTIFPGCPSYLSDSQTSQEERRRKENEQLLEAIQESALAFAAEQDENKVENFEDITSRLTRLDQKKFWSQTVCESCVIFAHVRPTDHAPDLLSSVCVSSDLCVRVFWKRALLKSNDNLKIPEKIQDFRRLVELLDNVEDFCTTKAPQEDDKVNSTLRLFCTLLQDVTTEGLVDDESADVLKFLKEQCFVEKNQWFEVLL
ncbi:hypothetical protein HPB51_011340 [Rhipicephalus microplus]|uniref:THAP-type domain-containing protein n=1 Tax=Rhipicephalus microplus TaxID=6941 RepID=A0A9J6F213_RHIMP|nr:hypothetical protein HPB51_011340 [Rhipicephalus microplus]